MSVPSVVEGWSLVRKLGEGADGIAALYRKGDQQAVFKFPSGTDHSYQAIEREDAVLKKIAQKKKTERSRLVEPITSVATNGQFVVEQYVEGITLFEYLRTYEISPAKADVIEAMIKTGVRELHNIGYAHMDLNPHNILIDPTTLSIHIIDYGRSAPVDMPLADYIDYDFDYPRVYDKRFKVGLRDDAWVAGVHELLRALSTQKIQLPIRLEQFNMFAPGYKQAMDAFMVKATAVPVASSVVENPFASPPKPIPRGYMIHSSSPQQPSAPIVFKAPNPYTLSSFSPPKPSAPIPPYIMKKVSPPSVPANPWV